MRMRRIVIAALVVLLAAPACGRSGKDDNAYRLDLDGRAEVVRGDDVRTVARGDHRLVEGDVVRMLAGQAELELPGDRSILLRAGRSGRGASVVEVAAAPDVIDGDAVVVTGDSLRFTAGDVDVALTKGAARVQRGLSVTVAVYAGAATVRSAGRSLEGGLAALRQVSVPGTGLLPREPSPLLYDEAAPDPWDRRFLGEAIDLGSELEWKARGFTGQLGPRVPVDATLLRRVLPPLEGATELDDALGEFGDRSAGETLVGAAIAVEASGGAFERSRWSDVFSFREDGARWGLVALDQQVQRAALLDTIDGAIGRSPLLFAAPGSTGGPTRSTTTTPDRSTTTDPGDTQPPPTTTPPTTAPPFTIPPITIPLLPEEDPPATPDPDTEPEDDDNARDSEEPSFSDIVHDIVDDLLGDDRPKGPRGR